MLIAHNTIFSITAKCRNRGTQTYNHGTGFYNCYTQAGLRFCTLVISVINNILKQRIIYLFKYTRHLNKPEILNQLSQVLIGNPNCFDGVRITSAGSRDIGARAELCCFCRGLPPAPLYCRKWRCNTPYLWHPIFARYRVLREMRRAVDEENGRVGVVCWWGGVVSGNKVLVASLQTK